MNDRLQGLYEFGRVFGVFGVVQPHQHVCTVARQLG